MATLSAPTYTGTIDNTINNTPQGDALVNSNQIQASKLGVSLPGVGTPAPKPTTPTTTTLYNGDGSVNTQAGAGALPKTTSPSTTVTTDSSQTDPRVQAANDLTAEQKKVDDAINNIQTGATPLNAGEQAQIDGLKSQYQQLITDQQDQNNQLTDAQNILDAREGRTQYMPMAHLQTISKITTAGTTAVSNLMVKEASAVAAMTQGFHDNDIKAIRDAWTDYQTASTARKDALQKTIDDTQKAIKDAADAKIAADKVTYDTVTKPIQDMAKQVADFNAPQSVIDAVRNSKTVSEAMKAGAGYFQDPTSLGGQYASYMNAAIKAGQTPISPEAFVNRQEYNKAYSTAKGTAAGKAAGEATGVGSVLATGSVTPAQAKALTANGFSNYNPTTQDLASQLVDGRMAPGELSKRATGTSSYNDVLAAANKYSQGMYGKPFNIAQADIKYKYANTPATQNTLKFLDSLVGSGGDSGMGGNLDQLINESNLRYDTNGPVTGITWGGEIIKGGGTFPPLNKVDQWASLTAGNPQLAAYHATLLEVSDQIAKILQGGSTGSATSDAKLQQAQQLFQSNFTPDQIKSVADAMKGLLANRAKSMIQDNPYLSDWGDKFGVQTTPNVQNQQIIMDEAAAESKITSFYSASPANKVLIEDIHKQFPDMSAQEVIQKLNI